MLLLVAVVAVPLTAFAEPPARHATKLSDRDFHTREAAGPRLEAFGEAALPALRHVLATGSPEATRRARTLVARIAARAENDKALAPRLVTLDMRDADFRIIADAVRKQTGIQLGSRDPAVLFEKFTVRATNRPFWEFVGDLQQRLGLEVVEVDNKRASILIRDTDGHTRRKQSLAKYLTIYAADSPRWQEINQMVQETEAKLKRLEAEAVEMDRPKPDRPIGTVWFGRVPRLPSDGSQIVRVAPQPFDGNLAEVSPEVIPLVLEWTAEPGKEFLQQDVFISKAVGSDGTKLTAGLPYTPPRYEPTQVVGWNPAVSSHTMTDSRLGHYFPNGKGVAVLVAPPGKPVTKLASVEGVVRGELWRAGRRVEVEVPFKLTDVPVAAGTRDPKPVASPGYDFNTGR